MELQINKTNLFKASESTAAVKQYLEPEFIITGTALLKCNPNGHKVVRVPEKVTYIGSCAFKNTNVEKVILPRTVRTINKFAFHQCRQLKEINFPEGLQRIGTCAFYLCTALESADLPKEMLYIESSAFRSSGLKHVTLPEKLTDRKRNGEFIFAETELETVEIPETLYLEDGMFAGCHNLKSVKFNKTGIDVPNQCFVDCLKLKDVDLNAISSFGEGAFQGCSLLKTKEITLDFNQTVYDGAFVGCPFEKVVINDVSKVHRLAFSSCVDLQEVVIDVVAGLQNVEVADGLFSGCTNLETVTFTDNADKSITHIGECAFRCCKLTEIKLPETLVQIKAEAFEGTDLCSISFPESLTTIAKSAFSRTNLTEVNIPDSVEFLGSNVFGRCKSLKTVKLSKCLNEIRVNCFADCNELCEVTGINNPIIIRGFAFLRCYNLKEFDFSKVISIERNAFERTGLKEIKGSANLKYIGKEAFMSCHYLRKVDLNECTQLNEIPERCFKHCFTNHECDEAMVLMFPSKALTFDKQCFSGTVLEHLTIYPGSRLLKFSLSGAEIQILELLSAEDETCKQTSLDTKYGFMALKVGKLIIPDYLYNEYKNIWDKIE